MPHARPCRAGAAVSSSSEGGSASSSLGPSCSIALARCRAPASQTPPDCPGKPSDLGPTPWCVRAGARACVRWRPTPFVVRSFARPFVSAGGGLQPRPISLWLDPLRSLVSSADTPPGTFSPSPARSPHSSPSLCAAVLSAYPPSRLRRFNTTCLSHGHVRRRWMEPTARPFAAAFGRNRGQRCASPSTRARLFVRHECPTDAALASQRTPGPRQPPSSPRMLPHPHHHRPPRVHQPHPRRTTSPSPSPRTPRRLPRPPAPGPTARRDR